MLRLSMIVKNEENRYLRPMLESARKYISDAVIIDDASTDGTVKMCRDLLWDIPHRIIQNQESRFHNEWVLRQQQWDETTRDNPDWILFLDADEIFEDSFASGVKELLNQDECDLYTFRLYDFWDENHYREDTFWCAHRIYRPFLLRYKKDFPFLFRKSAQHCGRMPANVFDLSSKMSNYRVRHYGWAKKEDRLEKYNRYMQLDPDGVYGSLKQYMSIMDENPILVKWEEPMITISLCMIVKNEEEVLARCLDSIKDAADEIIIVDTGSTDKTKSIASAYTEKVFDFEWINDFSAARNFAFSQAAMDYQMWLDADDVVPKDSLKKIMELKKNLDPKLDMVTMKYITHFDAQGNPVHSFTRERLTRREKGFLWQGPVHECIPLVSNTFYSDIEIHHKKVPKEGAKDRNLNIYNALESSGKELSPRQLYYFARELKDHGQWAKSAYYFERFLDTGKGWLEDNIASCYNLSICYDKLMDQQKILPILTKSFQFDTPRAEICSEIGYYYKRKKNYSLALKWFKLAASLGPPDSVGFILLDYWGYIPNVEACVCCYELGDIDNAKKHNELAAVHKPNAATIEINRKFLSSR